MRWCNKAYMFYYHHFNPQFNPQFNPRTHMGCDNVGTFSSSDDGFISIHAPTWGATRLDKRGSSSDKFQSTHPHGVRPADSVGISALTRFQSTHPHGVRLGVDRHNPRIIIISIHAPTWGATALYFDSKAQVFKFQSTHPHGVRPSCYFLLSSSNNFNPRTHMGCDVYGLRYNRGSGFNFNPRTHMGCDCLRR